MQKLRATDILRPVRRRLRTLGVVAEQDFEAFLAIIRVRRGIVRGESIVAAFNSMKHLTMLLDGLAGLSIRSEDGSRQIHAFLYPGDFVAAHGYGNPQSKDMVEVEALTDCSVGTIDNGILEQTMVSHPSLGLALWRAAIIEASILRQWLVTMRRPAIQRVAHLLCEQLARRAALGIKSPIIPLTQIEVADATGLSVVHTNRIIQDLRKRRVLTTKRQAVEIVNKQRLIEIAVFEHHG